MSGLSAVERRQIDRTRGLGARGLASDGANLSGLAGRYALALLELADEQKQLDSVADDLRALQALIAESDDLRKLMRSPLYGRDDQAGAMAAILEKAGAQDLTRRFVQVLAYNRRLFVLPDAIEVFLGELARRRGEITAHVSSAIELSDEHRDALTESLRKAMGGKIRLETKVDPGLIGGLVVRVGSRMIDNSLRSKLQRLQLTMKGAG